MRATISSEFSILTILIRRIPYAAYATGKLGLEYFPLRVSTYGTVSGRA